MWKQESGMIKDSFRGWEHRDFAPLVLTFPPIENGTEVLIFPS